MNMILHDCPTAKIEQGNTLTTPKFKDGERLRTYDYVVANPPFSDKAWTTGLNPEKDLYQRFAWETPSAEAGRLCLPSPHHSLNEQHRKRRMHSPAWRALSRQRRGYDPSQCYLLRRHLGCYRATAKPILWYGHSGVHIVVLDKENAAARKGIFMIDASNGFIKDGNKNRLREQDIHRIVDIFTKKIDVPRYARMVPVSEIADPKERLQFEFTPLYRH